MSIFQQVHDLTIDGQKATPEQISAIRKEVARIPESLRNAFQKCGGRIDVVPGSNATIHPDFAHNETPAESWTRGNLIAIAGEASPELALRGFARWLWSDTEDHNTEFFAGLCESQGESSAPEDVFAREFAHFYATGLHEMPAPFIALFTGITDDAEKTLRQQATRQAASQRRVSACPARPPVVVRAQVVGGLF